MNRNLRHFSQLPLPPQQSPTGGGPDPTNPGGRNTHENQGPYSYGGGPGPGKQMGPPLQDSGAPAPGRQIGPPLQDPKTHGAIWNHAQAAQYGGPASQYRQQDADFRPPQQGGGSPTPNRMPSFWNMGAVGRAQQAPVNGVAAPPPPPQTAPPNSLPQPLPAPYGAPAQWGAPPAPYSGPPDLDYYASSIPYSYHPADYEWRG